MSAARPSKSMLEDILERASDEEMIEQGLLPENCAFHLETALTFARKARTADTPEKTDEFIGVVVEQLEEIKRKVEAVK